MTPFDQPPFHHHHSFASEMASPATPNGYAANDFGALPPANGITRQTKIETHV